MMKINTKRLATYRVAVLEGSVQAGLKHEGGECLQLAMLALRIPKKSHLLLTVVLDCACLQLGQNARKNERLLPWSSVSCEADRKLPLEKRLRGENDAEEHKRSSKLAERIARESHGKIGITVNWE